MMKDSVSDVGARVGKYYDEKPWLEPTKKWNYFKTSKDYYDYMFKKFYNYPKFTLKDYILENRK